MTTPQNCRAVAASAMLDVVDHGQSLNAILPRFSKDVSPENKGLLQNLCFGTSRHFFSVNALSKILLQKPLPEEARPVQALLWVGLYQLAYSEISEHAAINETVQACRDFKSDKYRGLDKYSGVLNAILRRFQREKDELLAGLKESEVPFYQHPKWLIKLLKKAWPTQWKDICENGNIQAPMCLRVNTRLQSRDEYLAKLEAQEIKAHAGKHALTSIYLEKPCDVLSLPGFDDGTVSVQDEAAQLAAQLLQPQKGDILLDACCAPGGKTCHLLESVDNQATLTALDADEKRLVRVHENLARLKLSATVKQGLAQEIESWWDGTHFDRILLDVPCSATGVIRRHPDIKLLRQKADIDNLAELQFSILQKAWATLKPGGQLLYATCSILPQENANNIEAFLDQESGAQLAPLTSTGQLNAEQLTSAHDTGFGWQFFPKADEHDGFFYALLKKN